MSAENPDFIEVSIRDMGLARNSEPTWTNYKVLGMWERKAEGQDGKVEVYFPEHKEWWPELYGAEFGHSPDGLPQTKVVLEPHKVKYIGRYD